MAPHSSPVPPMTTATLPARREEGRKIFRRFGSAHEAGILPDSQGLGRSTAVESLSLMPSGSRDRVSRLQFCGEADRIETAGRNRQNRVTEFMRPVSACRHLVVCRRERAVVGKRAEQLVMTRAPLVDAGENRIDDAERSARPYALRSNAGTRPDDPALSLRALLSSWSIRRAVVSSWCIPRVVASSWSSGVLERANDGRADGDDPCRRARVRWRWPRAVRRESRTARRAAAACRARSPVDEMPAACVIVANVDAARAHGRERAPVEHETRRWRLERDRRAGDRRSTHPRAPAVSGGARTESAGRDARCPPRSRRRTRRTASDTSRGCPSRLTTVADSGPSARRSPAASAAAAADARCACGSRRRRRRSRRNRDTSRRRATGAPPAALRSAGRCATCAPCRLAGSVAASLAITRSPAAERRRTSRGAT